MGMAYTKGQVKATGLDQAYLTRVAMGMAAEMATAHAAMTTACTQFAAIAALLGVKTDFEHLPN
jgi:hypothetical protein